MAHELQRFNQFLRSCIEELINCHSNPQWIEDEFEFAQFVYATLEQDVFAEGQAWVEGAARAKENKRGQEARRKMAVVLAHQISKKMSSTPRMTDAERQSRLQALDNGWIYIEQLLGLNLSQIEACQTVLKQRCDCTKNCRKVNFTRNWKDIEKCCQQCFLKLPKKGNGRE